MATLASIFSRFTVAATAAEAVGSRARAQADEGCRLRAVPNEDVFFYVKHIDNSRVVRQANPAERVRNWKVVAGGCAAALLFISTLLPSAYGLMAGYRLDDLRRENQKLVTEKAHLELKLAELRSPENLQKLADGKFKEPDADSVVYLPPKNDAALALNRQ